MRQPRRRKETAQERNDCSFAFLFNQEHHGHEITQARNRRNPSVLQLPRGWPVRQLQGVG